MARLEYTSLSGNLDVVSLEKSEYTIGRDRQCELQISDGRISRRHAKFRSSESEWFVEDLGSKNGIVVNGEKTRIAKLRHGDVVGIGPLSLKFLSSSARQIAKPSIALAPDDVTRGMIFDEEVIPESRRRLRLILDVVDALDAFGSLSELVERFIELLNRLFEPTLTKIQVYDYKFGNNSAIEDENIEPLMERALKKAESLIGHQGDTDRQGSAMVTPILLEDTTVGFILLSTDKPEIKGYDKEDLLLLAAVARLIAAAIAGSKQYSRLAVENESLKFTSNKLDGLVGVSREIQKLIKLIKTRVGPATSTVLLTGETGTGKSLLAREIHLASERASGPFLKINCAAIPRELMESELFGHEKGAFSGASSRKRGLFEVASGGTILLDEIAELDPGSQAKLLSVLQDKVAHRVGGTQAVAFDVRIIAATNKDLEVAVEQGDFRSDLYYRLNVVRLRISPLRERPEDIPPLASHFLGLSCRELRRPVPHIDDLSLKALLSYKWPGNSRELANCIERALIFTDPGKPILPEDLPLEILKDPFKSVKHPHPAPKASAVTASEKERQKILNALDEAKGNKREAARKLGWYPQKLYHRLKMYGLME